MLLSQDCSILCKQAQDLLINLAMKQAFHIMQLPVLELAEWLHQEIEGNPVLEIAECQKDHSECYDVEYSGQGVIRSRAQELRDNKRQAQMESRWMASVSLYEHLMQQIPLHFEESNDRYLAQLIIGHLNEKGFLETPLEEISPSIPEVRLQGILHQIQQLDPPGIAARNVRESLLLQLKTVSKEGSLGYQIVDQYFDLLLHNQIPILARKLSVSPVVVQETIEKEILPLDLYPGYRFHSPVMTALVPDVFLCLIEGKWYIEVNTALLPKFHISSLYRHVRSDSVELSSYVRQKMASGKWLKRALNKRNHTLSKIVEFVLKKQSAFFESEGRGALVALTTKEASIELGLHESTVARAVAHKFIACPQGVFPLRCFFQQGVSSSSGERVSRETLKELLLRAVESEDKSQPLSDEELSMAFKKQGIVCARRTISKYRSSLCIAPASQRRRWD